MHLRQYDFLFPYKEEFHKQTCNIFFFKEAHLSWSKDQYERIWTPIAMTKMVRMPKYMMEWTKIEMPLVHMFPHSIALVLAGIWIKSPGDRSTKRITATTIGPQSAAISVNSLCVCMRACKWTLSLSLSRLGSNVPSINLSKSQCGRTNIGL